MKKVSILVPIYGVEKYIEQCVRSLFEQTYADIEYVFVDDCTKDRSVEILSMVTAAYPERKPMVKLIRHEHNQGLGAARRTACMAATGDYIMHVDSDDFLPTTAVATLMAEAERSQADIVDGAYAEWRGNVAGRRHVCGDPILPPHISKERYVRQLLCQNIISNRVWGRLYRRALLEEFHIDYIEGINYSEDYCWVTRAMFHATRSVTDALVYYYRMDNVSSYTHVVSEKNLLSYFKACQLVASFYEREDKQGRYRRAVDIGMVSAYRSASEHDFDLSRVDAICTYQVKDPICRLCIWMLRKGVKVKTVNYLYLAYRKIMTSSFF